MVEPEAAGTFYSGTGLPVGKSGRLTSVAPTIFISVKLHR